MWKVWALGLCWVACVGGWAGARAEGVRAEAAGPWRLEIAGTSGIGVDEPGPTLGVELVRALGRHVEVSARVASGGALSQADLGLRLVAFEGPAQIYALGRLGGSLGFYQFTTTDRSCDPGVMCNHESHSVGLNGTGRFSLSYLGGLGGRVWLQPELYFLLEAGYGQRLRSEDFDPSWVGHLGFGWAL